MAQMKTVAPSARLDSEVAKRLLTQMQLIRRFEIPRRRRQHLLQLLFSAFHHLPAGVQGHQFGEFQLGLFVFGIEFQGLAQVPHRESRLVEL